MYFFQSILLIFFILTTSFSFYQYTSNQKEIEISKKTLLFLYLFLIESLFLLFCSNSIYLIFLDFPIFLGYILKRRKEAFFLSILVVCYYHFFFQLPWYCYSVYLGYFLFSCFFQKRNNHISVFLLCWKAFFTSFFSYFYLEHSFSTIFLLLVTFSYFSILLEFTYRYIRKLEERRNDDTILFQIAHEVKNPIAVCKGYLDMMDTSNIEKVNQYLPIVRSEMNRALTIMDDFLNLKRLTIQKDIMDLYLLIEDIEVTMQSILSNKKVELEIPKIEEELLLEGDYERLKQVFVNLIKNAYEANANYIQLEITPKEEKIEIKITDNGDGMSEKELKKVGEIFYTTKVKGTGIGVSMSKEIIKLHQGSIQYDSKLGEGTKVTMVLPSKYVF